MSSESAFAQIQELVIETGQPVVVYQGASGELMIGVLGTMPDVDWEFIPVPLDQINMLGYAEYVAAGQPKRS